MATSIMAVTANRPFVVSRMVNLQVCERMAAAVAKPTATHRLSSLPPVDPRGKSLSGKATASGGLGALNT
uniref:Uncharacterized protein n=1 Tax=mine drainage metagenome TaxID=410659 RepID=E6PPC9_9ZZZZ